MYKYLLFDIDRTLVDFDNDMVIAFTNMLKKTGLDRHLTVDSDLIAKYNACNEGWWRRFERDECTKPELYRNRFIDFCREVGITEFDPDLMHEEYSKSLGETGSLLPGAAELLKKLSECFPIYLVTNGNAYVQERRIARSGLNNYAEAYYVSESVGTAKPDKRYFDYVLSHIPGAEPNNCIVIGDSLSSDILGAYNSSIDSIWYNPKHAENPKSIPFTYEVDNYEDLLSILIPKK